MGKLRAEAGVRPVWPPSAHLASSVPVARPGFWSRLAAKWDTLIESFVPTGYEDETGFHYGEMPADRRPHPSPDE